MIKKILVEKIKEEILGKRYELSLVFINKKEIKFLNKKYRNKNEATDTLSFSLDKNLGEIFICKEIAEKKKNPILFLVIHGCLHLKGLHHGVKMEAYEQKFNSRYRRGHF